MHKDLSEKNKVVIDQRYEFSCCACNKVQYLEPSLMMLMGINSGHGRCLSCKTFLHLEVTEDGTKAVSQLHSEYVKGVKIDRVLCQEIGATK